MTQGSGKTNPSKKVYVTFYDENDNEIPPTMIGDSIKTLGVTDTGANSNLEAILEEIRNLNERLDRIL